MIKTAGQIQNELIKKDLGKLNPDELGVSSTDAIWQEVYNCAIKHEETFSVKKYCVIMQYAKDPLLCTVVRRVFYAWPYLPDPRPEQSVWLYDMHDNSFRLLWALPDAAAMAILSETPSPNGS